MARRRTWPFVVLGGLSLSIASPAAAQIQPEAPPVSPEIPRFFARVSLGVGELWINDGLYSQWGRAVPLEVAGGLAIAPTVALFASVYAAPVVLRSSDEAELSGLNLYGAGPGVLVSLGRPNIFIGASASVSRLHIDRTGQPDATSHWGILGRLSVGTQWRVSPRWSLGLAGELTLGRMGWPQTGLEPEPEAYIAKGFALLFSGTVGSPSAETAGAAEGEPAPEHDHAGFYLNAGLGVGQIWVTGGIGTGGISGLAAPLDLAIGWALTPSLVAFGDFYDAYAPRPAFAIIPLTDLELTGVGPGVRYDWRPFDLYGTASVLVSRINYHSELPADHRYQIDQTSDWGLMGRVSVGKQWWVSARWGLGLAAEAVLGRAQTGFPGYDDAAHAYTIKGLAGLVSACFD